MKTVVLRDPPPSDMPFFKAVYEDAFPVAERCPWERMAGFLAHPDHPFRLQGVYLDSGVPVGFNSFAAFGRYVFAIYLAVARPYRGRGYGSATLRAFHAQHPGRLIFGEIEHPFTKEAESRLSFYRKAGYHITDIGFVQPPLEPSLQRVPYLIISFPEALTSADTGVIRDFLERTVYGAGFDKDSCPAYSTGHPFHATAKEPVRPQNREGTT